MSLARDPFTLPVTALNQLTRAEGGDFQTPKDPKQVKPLWMPIFDPAAAASQTHSANMVIKLST